MTTIHLTKHHALGNDFLVLLDAPDVAIDRISRGGCVIADAASAPTGCSSARPPTVTPPG